MTLRRSLFWSLSQQFGMMTLQLVNMVVIARLLTPEEIGVFIIALSIVMILQALREMGLTNYLIRAPELRDETIRATFGMSIALCLMLAAALFALRHPLENWINTPGLAAVLGPVVLVILIFPIEQPAMALIRREMRFDVLARISMGAKLLGVITSIALALMGLSTMALVWGLLADAVLRMVLLSRAEPRHLRLGPSIRGWRPLLSFGAWTSGASLAGQAAVQGNKILLGALLGVGPTAFFDRAVRIPGMVRMGLFIPLGRVLLSSFSEDLRQGRDIGPKVERVTAITTGMIWPTFTVLALLSEEIVALMLGQQWGPSAQILPWLLLAQAMPSMLPQPDQILVPYGHVRRLFILRFWLLAQTLFISYVALTWTIEGLSQLEVFAMFSPVTSILTTLSIWLAIRPYMGSGLGRIARGHLKSALMALATAAPVAAWKFGNLGDGSYVLLVLLMLLAALMGLGAGFAVNHPLTTEIRRTAAWLRKRKS